MSALVFVDTNVLLHAVDTAEGLQERFSSSFWDALIVAAAQVADCRFL